MLTVSSDLPPVSSIRSFGRPAGDAGPAVGRSMSLGRGPMDTPPGCPRQVAPLPRRTATVL